MPGRRGCSSGCACELHPALAMAHRGALPIAGDRRAWDADDQRTRLAARGRGRDGADRHPGPGAAAGAQATGRGGRSRPAPRRRHAHGTAQPLCGAGRPSPILAASAARRSSQRCGAGATPARVASSSCDSWPGLRPGLELDAVALGVRHVGPRDEPAVGRLERDDRADRAAARREHGVARVRRRTAPRTRCAGSPGRFIAGGSPSGIGRTGRSRASGRSAPRPGSRRWTPRSAAPGTPRPRREVGTGVVALRRDELAAEDAGVEVGERPPVAGDDVDVAEPRDRSRSVPPASGRGPRRPGPSTGRPGRSAG